MSRHERGGVYIAVLGVTLFVTLVGLSSMLLVETQRQTRVAVSDSRAVRIDARSALEIALTRVAGDPAWRSSYPPGAWTDAQSLGDTAWSFALEYDDSLPADEEVGVRFTVGARRSQAARVYSLDAVIPPAEAGEAPNLCPNGDFESTHDPWYAIASTIAVDPDRPHGGASCLAVSGRFIPLGGPVLETRGFVSDNTTYDVSLWVRTASASGETVEVSLSAMVGFTTTESKFQATDVGDTWTLVRGQLIADWEDGGGSG